MIDIKQLPGLLLDRGLRLYCVATGAGAGIQQKLWEIPGASSFLVGASFPYCTEQTDTFLGFKPNEYASPDTALDLAMEAFRRAVLDGNHKNAIGIGLAASVASTREHRGDHRIHVAVITGDRIIAVSDVLRKGVGREARQEDGELADSMALQALTLALDPTRPVDGPFHTRNYDARARFFEHPVFEKWRRTNNFLKQPIFPGAFNPPHYGHREIAASLGGCLFTVCANPPHKPALSVQEMLARSTFFSDMDVMFTEDDPLYIDKARRFPRQPIVMGADALLRMLDSKWGVAPEVLLAEFASLGTTFRIFGRVDGTGEFLSAEQVIAQIPEIYRRMFTPLPGRWDVSSSELRAKRTVSRSSLHSVVDPISGDVAYRQDA